MFNKLTLAAVVAVAGMMMGGSEAQADNCRYGRSGYGGGYGSFRAPAVVYSAPRTSYRYATPIPRYNSFSSPYRSGFGGYGYGGYGYGHRGIGYGSSFYGSPVYGRGNYIGVGRGGISIGFGF